MPCIIMYTWPHSRFIHPESSDPGRPLQYGESLRSSLVTGQNS